MNSPQPEQYLTYEVEDLLTDDRFVASYLYPDPEQTRFWENLASRDAAFATRMQRAHRQIDRLHLHYAEQTPAAVVSERSYQRLRQRQYAVGKPPTKRFAPARWPVGLAAAVALLVCGLAVFLWLSEPAGRQPFAYQTTYGERLHIELPDGSLVDLNANSSLVFTPADGHAGTRRAELRGEAFFSVAKDPEGRGFQVSADDLNVNVLGTRFSVHARGAASTVTLEEGSVMVDYATATTRGSVVMEPGEQVVYDTTSKAVVTERIVVEPVIAWKDGLLIFQNRRLEEATERLEEIFGVTIELHGDALRDRLIHMSTSADDLDVFFSTLDKLSPKELTINRQGDTIHLSEQPR